VRAGARFIATNRDPVYPLEKGLMPGAGSIVAAIETASGHVPISIGKPGPLLLEVAAHAVGADVTAAVMIGDSLVTDVAAAHAVGARSVLMLTGITTRAQLAAAAAADAPTEIAADAAELASALDRLATATSRA
jgi:ribonucleotide monophosphatase NagD (HAD superfamily)